MPTIDHQSLRDLTCRIFQAAGAPEDEARIVSEHLVNSNLVGHDSHGVWHVPGYARGMQRRYTLGRFFRQNNEARQRPSAPCQQYVCILLREDQELFHCWRLFAQINAGHKTSSRYA